MGADLGECEWRLQAYSKLTTHTSTNSRSLELCYEVLSILDSCFYSSGLNESQINALHVYTHMESLKCCLPSAAVLCKTGRVDAIYIFNKTFRLIFLVHNGPILRNRMASWFGVLCFDPYPQQFDCYIFQVSPPPCQHTSRLFWIRSLCLCHQVFKAVYRENCRHRREKARKSRQNRLQDYFCFCYLFTIRVQWNGF